MRRPADLCRALVLACAASFASAALADETINACIAAPTRACALDAALARDATIKDPALHASAIAFIAAAQQRLGLNAAAAANLARAIEETKGLSEPQSDRPRSTIIIAEVEMGDLAAANDARVIKTLERRIAALSGVAMALQRQGRGNEAAAYFEQAIGAAQSAPGIQRILALTAIARAQVKVGDSEGSATFDLARKAAEKETARVSIALVAMQQAEAGQFVQAFLAIHALEPTAQNYPLQVLATAEARAGRLQEAAAVAGSIYYEPARVAALATVATIESRVGQTAAAAGHIKDARQALAAIADRQSHDRASAALAGALAAANLTDEAKSGFDSARQAMDRESDAEARDALARPLSLALARAGRTPEAIETAARISSLGAKISALSAIAADREDAKAFGEAMSALLAIPADEARTYHLVDFAELLPR